MVIPGLTSVRMVMEDVRLSKDVDMGKVYNSSLIEGLGHCLLCARPGPAMRLLCSACEQDLPRLGHACPCCARPQSMTRVCGQCLKSPLSLTRVCSPFVYRYPLDSIIQRMKFRGDPALARDMGHIMAARIDRDQGFHDCGLVPVPLHPLRQIQRGFNQARVLAESLSQDLGLAVDCGCCLRHRHTLPQTRLTHKERSKNLKKAFYIKRLPLFSRVILVDDVMTTGHTLNELAANLLAKGVPRVDAWVLARTPEPGTY